MLSKAELIKRCVHYFDNKNVKVMFATEDGNFFHESGQHFAQSHARSNNYSEVIRITRADLKEKSKEEKPKNPKVKAKNEAPKDTGDKSTANDKPGPSENSLSFDELKAVAKKVKIKGWAIMKEETLKRKIAEANGTS